MVSAHHEVIERSLHHKESTVVSATQWGVAVWCGVVWWGVVGCGGVGCGGVWWGGVGWGVVGWAGLGWAGLGWAGLGWVFTPIALFGLQRLPVLHTEERRRGEAAPQHHLGTDGGGGRLPRNRPAGERPHT